MKGIGLLGRIATLLALLLVAFPPAAGELATESRIKAGFVANFIQFTTWPGNPQSITLCGIGRELQGDVLSRAGSASTRGQTMTIRRLYGVAGIDDCQAVFLDAGQAQILPSVLAATAGKPILVIADFDGGAPLGAALSLVSAGAGRLGFDANLVAAKAAGLSLSTRLLLLARRVY